MSSSPENPSAPAKAVPSHAAPLGGSVGHYENFPVASWLCPAPLRPTVAAIYHFARTADDIADEGDATAAERLADLAAYRAELVQCLPGVVTAEVPTPRWPEVFGPLARAVRRHILPPEPLHDLISAFEQDVRHTENAHPYANMGELLAYCRLSAQPVGRLLLHLYGVHDAQALLESDAICTALQLINFWQDLSVDIPRGRYYLTGAARAQFDVPQADILARRQTESATKLIAACADSARSGMLKGSQLVHRLPGRAGWELRLVVQGGLRILDKIAALDYATLTQRPVLRAWDFPVLLWRAVRM